MSRLPRLHVPFGIYSLVLRGNAGRAIFRSEADRVALSSFVGRSLHHTGARAHAFCWLGSEVSMAVQVSEEPIERFVRGIAGPYARRMNRQLGRRGHLFAARYTAVLIQDDLLPELVRHIHWHPVRRRKIADPADFEWSSHRAYLGLSSIPWLTTTIVLRRLSVGGDVRTVYRNFMCADNPRRMRSGFKHGSARDARAYGDASFLASLPLTERGRGARLQMSIDELAQVAALTLGLRKEEILSVSRRRNLSVARAVIAFHAVQGGIATLAGAARYLGRDASTISVSIRRYRKSHPELFGSTITIATQPAARSWHEASPAAQSIAKRAPE